MDFMKLYAVNVNDHTEDLKQGNTTLTYLSWTWAWAKIKELCPSAEYTIYKFNQPDGTVLPYMFDPKTGYMVMTSVTIDGLTHEMWLPVMDGANKAMKDVPYTYEVKEYDRGKWTGGYTEKTVQPATMFDVNKTIMRCLTKNLAMFGLGLYIYAGEDLPETPKEPEKVCEHCGKPIKPVKKADGTVVPVEEVCKGSLERYGQILCVDCMRKKVDINE